MVVVQVPLYEERMCICKRTKVSLNGGLEFGTNMQQSEGHSAPQGHMIRNLHTAMYHSVSCTSSPVVHFPHMVHNEFILNVNWSLIPY